MINYFLIVGSNITVLANGGLIAPSGTHMVALAAKYFKVPVVVCCGLYKLTPHYPVDPESFNSNHEPSQVIKFEDGTFTVFILLLYQGTKYISLWCLFRSLLGERKCSQSCI